jgi:hypothetical protein
VNRIGRGIVVCVLLIAVLAIMWNSLGRALMVGVRRSARGSALEASPFDGEDRHDQTMRLV